MLNDLIKNAKTIVVFAHKNVDGDALGSLLAMGNFIKNEYKIEPILSHEGVIPDNLRFLSNSWWLKKSADIKDTVFDLAISLDTGSLDNQVDEESRTFWKNAKARIKIDHHKITQSEIADLEIVKNLSSTCEILTILAAENNWTITPEIAQFLYLGMYTDTGGFVHDYTTGNTMRTAAILLDSGAIPHEIIYKLGEKTQETFSNNVETLSRALFSGNGEIGYTTFSLKGLEENARTHREGSWLHAQMLAIKTLKVSAIFKEMEEGKVSVSMRSKLTPVAKFAESMGGGGHDKAAAFLFNGPLASAVAQILPKLESYLKDNAGI